MADNKAEIVLDGDVSPLRTKLREAGRDLRQFGEDGRRSVESLGGQFGGLVQKLTGLTAVISVGGITLLAKQAIDAADNLNDLSQQLGINVPQLAGYKLAAESSGLTLEDFGNSVKRLSQYMTQYPERLAAVGVTSKTVDGALAQLADRFQQMPDGAEKTAVAMTLMGRSGAGMIPMLNAGGEELQSLLARGRELYPVTEEMAKGADQFNDKMAEMQVGAQGLVIQLGNKLLPILNAAIKAWQDNAREIGQMNGALVGLGRLGVVGQTIGVLWANVSFVFRMVGQEIGGIAAQLAALLRGDFKGARIIGDAMKADAAQARKELDDLEKRIMGLSKIKLPTAAAPAAKASSTAPVTNWNAITGGGKAAEDAAKAAEKAIAERIKAEKTAFDAAVKMAESYEDQWAREYAAVAAAARKSAQDRVQMEMLRIDGTRAAELARIDELESASQHELDLGEITQAAHLERMLRFNAERLAIERAYLDAKTDIQQQDPDNNPLEMERLEQQKLEIGRRYATQALDIQRQQALESQGIWASLSSSIEGLWDKGVNAIMNGTLTWRNAVQGIFAELANWFANQVVGQMVKDWVSGQVRKLAVLMGFTAQEKGIQAAAAASTVATKTAETTVVAGANAVQAGTGAAASQASIPFVGPMLALAAMAAVFAAVSALGKKKSAMGGYDIPKGLNPMTQLHEEEMVLPKQYANAIREMTRSRDSAGGAEAGAPITVNLSAVDARGVRDMLMNNQDALVQALKNAHRNGMR
jgi:hypothetical protein